MRTAIFALAVAALFATATTASAAVPGNDDFADADPITEGVEVWAELTDGSTEPGEEYCEYEDSPTLWWKFTAPTAGDYVTYATGANLDTTIAWAESLTDYGTVGCDDDSDASYDAVTDPVTLAAGEVEYVQLSAYEEGEPGASGVGVARVTAGADAFADRTPLTFRPGATTAVVGVQFSGSDTTESGEPTACGTQTLSSTVWLTFTPPSTQVWHIQAKFDVETQMSIYTGSDLADLEQLTCVSNEDEDGPSALAVELTAGTTYLIQLDDSDAGGEAGIVRAEPAGSFRSLATVIDLDGDGTSTDVGDESDAAILPDGRPVVAYKDDVNYELRFAERAADGTWSDTLIDADGDGTSTNVGNDIAMVLLDGGLVVAYSDDSNSQMRLAERANDGTWSESLVRGEETIGGHTYDGANGQPSLAVAPDGSLAIAVQDEDSGHTWFGVRSDGQWTIDEILTNRFLAEHGTSSWVKLHFDRAGNPVVIWVDENDDNPTGVSVRVDGTWREQVPVPFLLNPSDPSSNGSLEQSPDQFGSVVMPDGRIAFTAYDGANGGLYWVEDIHRTCPGGDAPFTDVDPLSYAVDHIDCIHALGITTGTTDVTYSPEETVTREQAAAFLARTYRAMTGDACAGGATPFLDVASTSFAADDIACIHGLGITTGTTSVTYSPSDAVTREQMAAFLARLYRLVTDPGCSGGTTPFTDVDPASFAADDIACIHGLGVTTGTTSVTYSPGDAVTREEVAAFLGRLWLAPAIVP